MVAHPHTVRGVENIGDNGTQVNKLCWQRWLDTDRIGGVLINGEGK